MDNTQFSLIEEFGIGYKRFGHSDLMGRIVGLLLSEIDPITIDEIANKLSVTRTPVNDVLKRLENHSLIQRVWVKGNRKHHYKISSDVFYQAGLNFSIHFKLNLKLAKNYLKLYLSKYYASSGDEKENLELICNRFITMYEFHKASLESYNKFLKDWESHNKDYPSFEEYHKEILLK